MKIGVIGAGRLGLTFALLCEKAGYDVLVSDKREDYIQNLNQGVCSTNEPMIQEMLSVVYDFSATTDNIEIIRECDVIFTFVATPSTVDGNYDTSKVFEVANDFFTASQLDIPVHGKKLIIGCTTNPGDIEQIQDKLRMFDIQVAYNPEFIAQGEIVKGLEQSDIVLIGTEYTEIGITLVKIYEKIQTTPINAHIMSSKAAEITKIGINCFLTNKISYANMMGDILMKAGLNKEIDTVLSAIGGDSRVGKKYMKYGFGFGGPCLPRDNRALSNYAKKYNANAKLSVLVDEMNIDHTEYLADLYMKKNPDKKIPFVMKHISYKKGTDIITDSQQYNLCLILLSKGYTVFVQEIDAVIDQFKFKDMGEMEGRLKFFKYNTKPEGYLIDL